MSKIKDEKTAKELFGIDSAFGIVSSSIAREEKGLSGDELIDSVDDPETRELLREKKSSSEERKSNEKGRGRGRPKSEESDLWQKMTFQVSKAQLARLKEIAYNDRLLVKDVLFEALERYFADYELETFEHVKLNHY